jgi:hypothetical protein
VLADRLGILANAVPLTPGDLPGYAAALFDHLIENPGYMRLTMWRRLERPGTSAEELAAYAAKVSQLEAALALGGSGVAAIDLLMLALPAAFAWGTTTPEIRALDPGAAGEADRLARHRRALEAGVAATVAALAPRPVTLAARRGRTALPRDGGDPRLTGPCARRRRRRGRAGPGRWCATATRAPGRARRGPGRRSNPRSGPGCAGWSGPDRSGRCTGPSR